MFYHPNFMNTSIWISEYWQGNSEKGALLSRLFWTVKNNTQVVLNTLSDSPEETLMFMIYDGKFPQMKDNNEDSRFYRKHSGAPDEWCMKISSLQSFEPYHMNGLIKNLYESEKMTRWSNHDDFAFYVYLWEYVWRKLRIIFYNSCDYSKDGGKKPFKSLLVEDQPIRICWY